jgi:plastocyanin
VEVAPGSNVVFINEDDAPHTVEFEAAGLADSDILEAGDRHTVMFEGSGTFGYECSLHPDMTGTITVSG